MKLDLMEIVKAIIILKIVDTGCAVVKHLVEETDEVSARIITRGGEA